MSRSGILCAVVVLAVFSTPAAWGAAEKGDWVIRVGGQTVDPSGEYETTQGQQAPITLDPAEFPDVLPSDRTGTLSTTQEIRFSGDSDTGFFATIEYRVTDLVGLEIGVSEESADLSGFTRLSQSYVSDRQVAFPEVGGEEEERFEGTLDARPITLAINVHHDFGFAELTIGALGGYVLFDNFSLDGVDYAVDDGFGWGWQAGMDFPIGESRWFVALSVRYLKITADVEVTDLPKFSEDTLGDPVVFDRFEDTTFNYDPYVVRLGAGYRF